MENEICETKSFEKCVVHFSLNMKVTKKIVLKNMILIVTVLPVIGLIASPKCRDQNPELATIRFGLEFTKVTKILVMTDIELLIFSIINKIDPQNLHAFLKIQTVEQIDGEVENKVENILW